MANTNQPPLDTPTLDDGNEPEVRRARVVNLKRRGCTFEQIGREMGVSRQRAHQLYREALDRVEARAVHSHRAEMVGELADVIEVAQRVMHTDHVAHSNGRVVMVADGNGGERPAIDDGPKLDAGRTIIAAHARMAKLVGADAPTQVAQDVTVNYTVGGGIDPTTDLT